MGKYHKYRVRRIEGNIPQFWVECYHPKLDKWASIGEYADMMEAIKMKNEFKKIKKRWYIK